MVVKKGLFKAYTKGMVTYSCCPFEFNSSQTLQSHSLTSDGILQGLQSYFVAASLVKVFNLLEKNISQSKNNVAVKMGSKNQI